MLPAAEGGGGGNCPGLVPAVRAFHRVRRSAYFGRRYAFSRKKRFTASTPQHH